MGFHWMKENGRLQPLQGVDRPGYFSPHETARARGLVGGTSAGAQK